jgi:hypothetical protein
MFQKILKLAKAYEDIAKNYYLSSIDEILFEDISIHLDGLRDESFKYLEPFFEDSEGYPSNFSPILLSVYKENPDKIFVRDGRHRLILSKKYNIKSIPAILISYDENANSVEKNVVINVNPFE